MKLLDSLSTILSLGLENNASIALNDTSGVHSIASSLVAWFNDFTCLGFSPNIYGASDITAYVIKDGHKDFLLKTFSRFSNSGAYLMLSCSDDAKNDSIDYMSSEVLTKYMFGNVECTLSVGRRMTNEASR